MAIAFDTKVHLSDSGGSVTSKTQAFTTSGSNRYLVVFTEGSTVSDRITGVTYAGVSMVQATNGGVGYKGDSGRYLSTFVLANPTTGTNNIVISSSPADIIGASMLSFTGCQQTNTPDSNNTATQVAGLTFTLTTTVVATGCWLTCFGHGNVNADGTGGTSRGETYADGYASEDSNGTVGTGSQSISFGSLSLVDSGLVISIAPTAGVATTTNTNLLMMGV